MRRKDREMDADFAWSVFDKATFATISMVDGDGLPYSVPVIPAREGDVVYVHCFKEGRKFDILKEHPHVCMNAVSIAAQMPRTNDLLFASAVLYGKAEILEDDEEKTHAMRLICQKHAPDNTATFDRRISFSIPHLGILKIRISEITGKANLPAQPTVVIK